MGYVLTRITTKKLLRQFLKLPWKIYRDYPEWVAPILLVERQRLNPKHNPFLGYGNISLFGVIDAAGKMQGRIAAVQNPVHNRLNDPADGFFGLFECIENIEVAALLFDAVENELAAWGLSNVIGPVNFTTNDESGFLLEGYDRPATFLTNYCPAYYPLFMDRLGFSKAEDLIAYEWTKDHWFPDRFQKIVSRTSDNPTISIRKFRKKEIMDELAIVQKIYNDSFQGLKGFVPLNQDEMKEMSTAFKLFADYDLILFSEYNEKPVGFCLTLPDLNEVLAHFNGRPFPFGYLKFKRLLDNTKKLRLIVLAVLPGYRNRGIVVLLIQQAVEEALKKGYETGELSVVMESNTKMKGLIESLGFRQTKLYRIYSRPIGRAME